MQTHLMQTLRWLRMIGDTVFALGAISFVYFALSLMWQGPEKKAATVPSKAVEVVS
jgi:nitric oxide reductase large subunit